MQNIPRNRLKTRTGCLRCKQRKIKCDEALPHCNQCMRRGYECPGYKRPLKWSSKYEVGRAAQPGQETPPGSDSTPPENDSDFPCRPELPDLTLAGDEVFPAFPIELVDESTHFPQWLDVAAIGISGIPPALEDEDTSMFRYYFTTVCRVNSCFDSARNFFRLEIGNLTGSCLLIYHSILSMSAAHLAANRTDMAMVSLRHKTQAITSLNREITQFSESREAGDGLALDFTAELLLATVILGMTDGWHNPSSLGITHLHGARTLLKKWLSNKDGLEHSSRLGSFVVGVMAYWEAMSSFLIAQPLDKIEYMDQFEDLDVTILSQPNPWTGICTPLFVYLAKAGTLVRQRLSLRKLACDAGTASVCHTLDANLLEHARTVEKSILSYRPPNPSQISQVDTEDARTPTDHLVQIARIYRLSALLELYCSFPELVETNAETDTQKSRFDTLQNLLSMGTSILTLIAAVPASSGVTCLLTLPLIIAGSTLQHVANPNLFSPNQEPTAEGISSQSLFSTELAALPNIPAVLTYYRNVVRERIIAVHRYVGVAAIARGLEILEKVWARSDLGYAVAEIRNDEDTDGNREEKGGEKWSGFVLWTDVMVDERLETIFG